MSYEFKFETEVQSGMESIPFATQYRMDSIGVRIRPETWNVLSKEARLLFSHLSVKTDKDKECYRTYLLYLLKRRRRTVFVMSEEQAERERAEWENLTYVPVQVYKMVVDLDYTLSLRDWIKMSDLNRYILVKLSKARHTKDYLDKALMELLGAESQVTAWKSETRSYSNSLGQVFSQQSA
jgi:hypothetical protein